jgi:serine/threonine protein phosphatase 1
MGRLLAISDIHGCYDAFHELVIRSVNLNRSDKLILLGDYVDRGDKSRDVIDFIIDLIGKGFDVTPLLGNHEDMLLDAWENFEMLPLWLLNSGNKTMESFEIQHISDIQEKYLDFFRNLNYYEKTGDFLFVHAGFNDSAEDPFTDKHGMIWESHQVYKHPLLQNKTIIHGHRPKQIGYIENLIRQKSRVIPIDTGCVYEKEAGYGNLSALDVGAMKLISVKKI